MGTNVNKITEHPYITLQDLLGHPLNDVESKFEPRIIYHKGRMRIPVPSPRVSIIGSRRASKDGLNEAGKITKFLIGKDVVIVSGLAKGIDTVAHQTAIGYNGKTIAVLGTPLDRVYPRENSVLQEKIMKDHLAISQYKTGHRTTPKDFILRNRTMALISDASVIVEAGDSSGTLYQGWETLRLGRPLFICKAVTRNRGLEWPSKMINYGAVELEDYLDILEILPYDIDVPAIFSGVKKDATV